jgi:hypothetical protein
MMVLKEKGRILVTNDKDKNVDYVFSFNLDRNFRPLQSKKLLKVVIPIFAKCVERTTDIFSNQLNLLPQPKS